ncbi:zinc knuckle-domain-containing protein [Bisporella sp. PMI_857]|nr:zinc knuckle-domain-containing protein [Bisporella sp. PMI_857]
MHHYGRGGPSRATASTTCQKCLKKGHYSYECKAVVQERPYVSRPSRTQQLFNPRLVPKLTSDAPKDLLRKKGVADDQLAKLEQERGRKRERRSEEPEAKTGSKRRRSASSSESVSTISTNISRSPSSSHARSPSARGRSRESPARTREYNQSTEHQDSVLSRQSLQTPRRSTSFSKERKRRRGSFSSSDSFISEDGKYYDRRSGEKVSRRRFSEHSPPGRGRRTESKGFQESRTGPSSIHKPLDDKYPRTGFGSSTNRARERTLSPFSRRRALTRAMGSGV